MKRKKTEGAMSGSALMMLLSTSILLACGQPSAAVVTPSLQTSGPAQAALPKTGERTYRIAPQQSTASYQAQEKWLNWPAPTKAVAKTGDVEGELSLLMGDQPKLTANRFRVDMRTLVSEVAETPLSGPAGVFLAQRDQMVRGLLETVAYPFAEFAASGLEGLPARYVEGRTVRVRVPGELTIRGMMRHVVLDTEAMLQGETLIGTASAQILMTDFGVSPPGNNGAMDVENELTLVVQFVAKSTSVASPQVSLDDRDPKLDTPLAMVARVARDQGTDEGLTLAKQMDLEVAGSRIRVVVSHSPAQAEAARAVISDAGGQVEARAVAATGALIPVSAIEELAGRSEIRALRIPLREG